MLIFSLLPVTNITPGACCSCTLPPCVRVHMRVHLSSLSGVWLPLKGLLSTSPGSMGTCAQLNPPFGCGGLLQTNRPALRPAAPQVGSWLSLPSLAKKPLAFLLRSLICFT